MSDRTSSEVADAAVRPYDAFRLREEQSANDALLSEARSGDFDGDAEQSSASLTIGLAIICALACLAWALFGIAIAGHALVMWIAGMFA